MAEPGLDQRRLVERAEGDGVDDAVARHFQRAVQVAQCGAAVLDGDFGKPDIVGRDCLAVIQCQTGNVGPLAVARHAVGHLKLDTGLPLPHFEQVPVADQQDVGLAANLLV